MGLKKFYVAHTLDERVLVRSLIENNWKKKFLSLEFYNPFYDSVREDIDLIDSGKLTRYQVDHVGIVRGDLKAMLDQDVILAILPTTPTKAPIGTIMEIVYGFTMGKYVWAVGSEHFIRHPWIKYHTNNRFEDLAELEDSLAIMDE